MNTKMTLKIAAAAAAFAVSALASAQAQDTAMVDVSARVAAHTQTVEEKLEARIAARAEKMLEARIAHVEETSVPEAVYASRLPQDEQLREPAIRLAANAR